MWQTDSLVFGSQTECLKGQSLHMVRHKEGPQRISYPMQKTSNLRSLLYRQRGSDPTPDHRNERRARHRRRLNTCEGALGEGGPGAP